MGHSVWDARNQHQTQELKVWNTENSWRHGTYNIELGTQDIEIEHEYGT